MSFSHPHKFMTSSLINTVTHTQKKWKRKQPMDYIECWPYAHEFKPDYFHSDSLKEGSSLGSIDFPSVNIPYLHITPHLWLEFMRFFFPYLSWLGVWWCPYRGLHETTTVLVFHEFSCLVMFTHSPSHVYTLLFWNWSVSLALTTF